jgi:hypothetical protein
LGCLVLPLELKQTAAAELADEPVPAPSGPALLGRFEVLNRITVDEQSGQRAPFVVPIE